MARLLVVEDDRLLRLSLAKVLEKAGHCVLEAGDGLKGLEVARRAAVDLVITDIVMPNQDGIQLIRELRRVCPDLKIIALSGGGRIDAAYYLALADKFGADEILKKPFGMSELLHAVDSCMA